MNIAGRKFTRREAVTGMGLVAVMFLCSPKLCAVGGEMPAQGTEARRPNIVYLFTDQQSASMMSCTGNTWLKTSAMDYLAANGTRFERAYAWGHCPHRDRT